MSAKLPNATPNKLRQVAELANSLEIHPLHLIEVIHFESGGTWDPSLQNRIGATGLIQFTRRTALKLGTTTDELRAMSFSAQLRYVDRYFREVKAGRWDDGQRGELRTLQSVAMAVFYPWARYWSPDREFPSIVTDNNPGVRTPRDYLNRLERFNASGAELSR